MSNEIFDHLYAADRIIRVLRRWRMAPGFFQFTASWQHHRLLVAFYRIAPENLSTAVDRIRRAIPSRFFIIVFYPGHGRCYTVRRFVHRQGPVADRHCDVQYIGDNGRIRGTQPMGFPAH